MSIAYRTYPYAFLDNQPTTTPWNPQYTTELLPLFDSILDNLQQMACLTTSPSLMKSIFSLFSNFSRFVRSNQEDVDTIIRVRYNDWLNEFLPSLGLSKDYEDLRIDLPIVSRELCEISLIIYE